MLECLEVQSLISGQWRIQDLQTGGKVERRQFFLFWTSNCRILVILSAIFAV